MLNGAVLSFTDQRCSCQDNRQHGDLIDSFINGAEPTSVEISVEFSTNYCLNAARRWVLVCSDEIGHLITDNPLNMPSSRKCLTDLGSVDIQLNGRLSSGQQITLKVRRNIKCKGITPRIHATIHLANIDKFRRQKIGKLKGINNT